MKSFFSYIKEEIREALQALPAVVNLPNENSNNDLYSKKIKNEVLADIAFLHEWWNFGSEYQDKYIVALLGMVNTGKSSIGNVLLGLSETEGFKEAPIRETSKASIKNLNEKTLIVDLPGLGSVLAEEDDAVVQKYVTRANLLLIVLSINEPIPNHLYQFLMKPQVIKTQDAQRIAIVLNKLDVWHGIPDEHIKKKIDTYKSFLIKGSAKLGFSGIGNLFNYQIPIIPFSVQYARQGNTNHVTEVHQVITQSLALSSNGSYTRMANEMLALCYKWQWLSDAYSEMCTLAQSLETSSHREATSCRNEIAYLLSANKENLKTKIYGFISAYNNELLSLPRPHIGQSFLKEMVGYETRDYKSKRDVFYNSRDRNKKSLENLFEVDRDNLIDNVKTIILSHLGNCPTIVIPDEKQVNELLNYLVYELWNVLDNQLFLGYNITDQLTKYNTKYHTQTDQIFDEWFNVLSESTNQTIKQAQDNGTLGQAKKVKQSAKNLEKFTTKIRASISSLEDFLTPKDTSSSLIKTQETNDIALSENHEVSQLSIVTISITIVVILLTIIALYC